jgi:hypothetical protein
VDSNSALKRLVRSGQAGGHGPRGGVWAQNNSIAGGGGGVFVESQRLTQAGASTEGPVNFMSGEAGGE